MELRIHTETWQTTLHAEMTAEDHNSTKLAWAEADEAEDEDALATGKLKFRLGVLVRPSLLNYFNALRLQFSDSKAGFLPQTFQSHTKTLMPPGMAYCKGGGIKASRSRLGCNNSKSMDPFIDVANVYIVNIRFAKISKPLHSLVRSLVYRGPFLCVMCL